MKGKERKKERKKEREERKKERKNQNLKFDVRDRMLLALMVRSEYLIYNLIRFQSIVSFCVQTNNNFIGPFDVLLL